MIFWLCKYTFPKAKQALIKFMKFSIASFLQFTLYVQEMILFVHDTMYFKMGKEKKQTKPTFGFFFPVVPNPMYPAKKSEKKKSVQVLKHQVSNILIFQ
jgi:hypothetical protein